MTLKLKDSKVLQFNPNALQAVRKEFGFDHPGMCRAIDILEEWSEKQEHFVKKDFNRDYLERVIITCKGSIEVAKKRVDKMCTMRTALPEFFDKFDAANDFPGLKEHLLPISLPKQTDNYCRIHITDFRSNNLTAAILMQAYKFTLIMSEYMKLKDYSQGVSGVFDMRKIKIMNFLQNFNPIDFRNFMSLFMEGYGFRVKAIYILSASKNISIFVNIIKPFFSAKVAQRIQVLPDLESLHKCLPKYLLSEDYGGEQEPMTKLFDNWAEKLSTEENVKYMKEARQFCTNESMRRLDKFNEEYFGMPGTFKTLNVD